jgi:hypothetical protein
VARSRACEQEAARSRERGWEVACGSIAGGVHKTTQGPSRVRAGRTQAAVWEAPGSVGLVD